VKLAIVPKDAQVEIEGAAAKVSGGAVEITGKLGSVHRVRVHKGAAQTTEDVVVTETGALPAKVELGAKSTKAAAPVVKTGAPTAAPGPTTKAAPAPTFRDKFE
jgi:serine/threonine-protein kinase